MTRDRQPLLNLSTPQMRSNQAGTGEMEFSAFQRGQQIRKLASRPSHCDSFVRNTFGEMEQMDAVVEHRGTRLPQIEPPRIDLTEMSD